MKPKTVALIIVILLALILILPNTQVATFRFFFIPIRMSQIVMTLFTLACFTIFAVRSVFPSTHRMDRTE